MSALPTIPFPQLAERPKPGVRPEYNVAHHTALAYQPFAPPPPHSLLAVPRWWQVFPVVDSQHSMLAAIFVGFNDTFFMALMFFLSGLFVCQSLRRKGPGTFLRDRALRLGIPFVAAAAIVAPVAYYPTYLQSRATGGEVGFWHQWLSLGNWPAGPAWFVWVLLAFDMIAAALFTLFPRLTYRLGHFAAGADRSSSRSFLKLVGLSAIAYVPLAFAVNPLRWSSFGPFTFQTSRILNYLLYFLLGAGVGACGLDSGLLARQGKLSRRWRLWCLVALVAFGTNTAVGLGAMTTHLGSHSWEVGSEFTFVVSCAASSLMCLALFVRFVNRRNRIFDSINANAYGVYLIHYAFVSWLLYAALTISLSAAAKFTAVFLTAVLLSWAMTALLRRIPAVARLL
jgi:hypothetical protein